MRKTVKKVIAIGAVLVLGLACLTACGSNASQPAEANASAGTESNPLTEQVEDSLHASIQHEQDSPDWVKNLPQAQEANQLFVVAAMGMDKTTASISMHEKDENGNWKQIMQNVDEDCVVVIETLENMGGSF